MDARQPPHDDGGGGGGGGGDDGASDGSRFDDDDDDGYSDDGGGGGETTTQANSLYEAFGDLSLVYLRKALSREGVSTTGTKPELASRLVSVVSEAQDYAEELEQLNMVELRRLAFENNVKESERDGILKQLMINYRDKRVPKLFMGMSMSTAALKSYVVAGKEGLTTRRLIATDRNAMIQVSFLNAEPVTAVRFVTALDRGRLEFQRDIYQMPLRALFNGNAKKLDSSAYWIKPYFDITADLDVSAEIITDLMIEAYVDTVFERLAHTPEYSSSAVQRMVVALPYHVMVSLPQLAHIREAVSEALSTQPTEVEFSLVSNLMAAAVSYAVPIKSLEEEEGTLRMPVWTAPLPQYKEVFVIHVGLGFSSCAGFLLTSEEEDPVQAWRNMGGGANGGGGNDGGVAPPPPTMVSLCQKSVAFGVKDFLDHIVDSSRFTAAVSRQLTDFASQHQGVRFHHSKDFVYKSFETYMAVWAERIEQQVRAAKTAAERDAILVRDDAVKVNFSMYSDHKAAFNLSVQEVYRMCGPVWQTLQNLVVQAFRECDFRTVPTVLFVRDDKQPVPLLQHKLRNLAVRLQKSKRKQIARRQQAQAAATAAAAAVDGGGGLDDSRSRHRSSSRRSTHLTPRSRRQQQLPGGGRTGNKASGGRKEAPLPRNVTLPSSCFETGATICAFLSWMHKHRRRPLPRENHPWARFAHRMYVGSWDNEDRLGAGPRKPAPDNRFAHGVGGGGGGGGTAAPATGTARSGGGGGTVNLSDLADRDLNGLRQRPVGGGTGPAAMRLKQRSATEQAVLADGMAGVNPRTYGRPQQQQQQQHPYRSQSQHTQPGRRGFLTEAVV